jgi:hypothetical protein
MPAHCSHEPLSQRTKSCLEWDEYDEAAFEMWEMATGQALGGLTIKTMSHRLRQLLPPGTP